MKHLLKKISLAGGGKKSKPKPKPAILYPPQLGDMQLVASYSYAETLDLISDGPIEGLVNKNGLRLSDKDILQGIYLDDTVIAVSNDAVVESKTTYDNTFIAKNSDYIKSLKQFFTNLQNLNIIVSNVNILPNKGYKVITAFDFNILWGLLSTTLKGFYFTANDSEILKGNSTNSLPVFTRKTSPYDYGVINSYKQGTYANTYPLAADQNIKLEVYIDALNNIGRVTPANQGSVYNPNASLTDKYLNNFLDNEMSNVQNLIKNKTTYNDYEKTYLDNMFINNFGTNQTTSTTLYNWLKNTEKFDYQRDMIFVIKVDESIIEANKLIGKDKFKFIIEDSSGNDLALYDSNVRIYDFILPRIDGTTNKTTGNCFGCLVVVVKGSLKYYQDTSQMINGGGITHRLSFSIPLLSINLLANASKLSFKKILITTNSNNIQKYNYANILAEFKKGDEFQYPFKYFKNTLIDKDYNTPLIGPFKVNGNNVQAIKENKYLVSNNPSAGRVYEPNLTPTSVSATGEEEGSDDKSTRRSGKSYSNWNVNEINFNESANSIKHIINNPNVSQVFITILINQLSDTLSLDLDEAYQNKSSSLSKMNAGTKFPTILNIEVETGSIDDKGNETISQTKKYKIVALIESPTRIDIGNPDLSKYNTVDYKFISQYDSMENIFTPFNLPIVEQSQTALDLPNKRYIKVTKLSTETNSTLIEKNISLSKVTEIIPLNFNYPYSAIVATKIDSRSFSNIPSRTFDCKLKKVRVPSNYNPLLSNGKDKRYYSTQAEFNSTSQLNKLIYDGDWDGTFKNTLEWTDNPAWILLDLITNERYGLGQYMDASQIDIFDLYKIARFCDAVDDYGYFEGVSDNAGGLEPRFSCNIMFQDGIKVFDALNTIATLFRGMIYYNNSQINFVDDRPKEPSALFANSNVKDGVFNYTNYRRDEQFNSIEVVYIDRFENFLTKVEYVEDEEDIRKRGVFKKTINANGVTSKAMARRMGQHIIFQTIKENQSVSFTSGLESLLCKPGDLIIIEDELKSLKSNFGRVLSVNSSTGSIRLNEKFVAGEFDNKLTLYTPTGYNTYDEISTLATSARSRINNSGFYLTTGGWNASYNYLTGFYGFSGYKQGFDSNIVSTNKILKTQYAFYTGTGSNFCYFDTTFTGWILGTGAAFTTSNTYNKFIFDQSNHDFTELNRGITYNYNSSIASGRGSSFTTAVNGQITGADSKFRDISGLELTMTHGLLDSEISLSSFSQITTFSVSGISEYDYGCEVFVDQRDINYNLIPFIKQGSVYRFQRKLADDQIYKVISIKEENPNEYSLICTKFNTGKYALIEKNQSIESLSNTYSYTLTQKIGNINYKVLNTPIIQSLTTGIDSYNGQFYISGQWKQISDAKGYNVKLYEPNGTIQQQNLASSSITGAKFYIEGIGNYSYRVNSSGSYSNSNTNVNAYFDSDYTASGLFLVYDGALTSYDRPFLSKVKIL
jgi:hypothetical protein